MATRKRTAPKTQTIKAPGKEPITFKPGGLHESLGVKQGEKIPPAKVAAAARGDYGPKAQKQAQFAQNVLTGPKGSGGGKGASRGRSSK